MADSLCAVVASQQPSEAACAPQASLAQVAAAPGAGADEPTCARALPYTGLHNVSGARLEGPMHAPGGSTTLRAASALASDPQPLPGAQLTSTSWPAGTRTGASDYGPALPSPAGASPPQTDLGHGGVLPAHVPTNNRSPLPIGQAAINSQQQGEQGAAPIHSGAALMSAISGNAASKPASHELVDEDDGPSEEAMQVLCPGDVARKRSWCLGSAMCSGYRFVTSLSQYPC